MKKAVREAQKDACNIEGFRKILQQKGISVKIQYSGEFKPNQKNEIQDIWINKVDSNQQKNGFFFRKNVGFSLSATDSDLDDLLKSLSENGKLSTSIMPSKSTSGESVAEIASNLLEELLKPNYVAQNDDELWKKKRKSR